MPPPVVGLRSGTSGPRGGFLVALRHHIQQLCQRKIELPGDGVAARGGYAVADRRHLSIRRRVNLGSRWSAEHERAEAHEAKGTSSSPLAYM